MDYETQGRRLSAPDGGCSPGMRRLELGASQNRGTGQQLGARQRRQIVAAGRRRTISESALGTRSVCGNFRRAPLGPSEPGYISIMLIIGAGHICLDTYLLQQPPPECCGRLSGRHNVGCKNHSPTFQKESCGQVSILVNNLHTQSMLKSWLGISSPSNARTHFACTKPATPH